MSITIQQIGVTLESTSQELTNLLVVRIEQRLVKFYVLKIILLALFITLRLTIRDLRATYS